MTGIVTKGLRWDRRAELGERDGWGQHGQGGGAGVRVAAALCSDSMLGTCVNRHDLLYSYFFFFKLSHSPVNSLFSELLNFQFHVDPF